MNRIACGLLLVLVAGLANATTKLQERYSWRQLDWVFPSQTIRDRALASGDYIPTNGLPVGIERWQNKLFVSVPRWRNGQFSGKAKKNLKENFPISLAGDLAQSTVIASCEVRTLNWPSRTSFFEL